MPPIPILWSFATSPMAAILASLFGIVVLVLSRQHRDANGQLLPSKMVACFLLTASSYIFSITIIGHFALHVPASLTITRGFGDENVVWLLIGVVADSLARLYALYESP